MQSSDMAAWSKWSAARAPPRGLSTQAPCASASTHRLTAGAVSRACAAAVRNPAQRSSCTLPVRGLRAPK
jgi:hypothetical protein